MRVFLLTLAVFGIAYGAPASSSEESSESKETSKLDKVLENAFPEHDEGIKQMLHCIIDNTTLSDDEIADNIAFHAEDPERFFLVLKEVKPTNFPCLRQTGDKFVTATANVLDTFFKDKDEIRRDIHENFKYLENISFQEYIEVLKKLQPKRGVNWYLRCPKTNSDRPLNKLHNIAIALGIIAEELVPGSGLPVDDPTHYLNPNLFTTGNVRAQELIVNCIRESKTSESSATTEAPVPPNDRPQATTSVSEFPF